MAEWPANGTTDWNTKNEAFLAQFVDTSTGALIKAAVAATFTPAAYAGGESVTYPNGEIKKQGEESVTADATDTVTFAVAFPNECTRVLLSAQGTNTAAVGIGQDSAKIPASFDLTNAANATVVYNWVAWGY
jgi:hypothetical protein